MQLTHYNSKFKPQQSPITLICDSISNASNVGSLFRTADAFGIEQLIFCGDSVPLGNKMKKTSRSTEKYVTYNIHSSVDTILPLLQKSHHLIALEITEHSKPLSNYKITTKKPIAVIIGNENFGIANSVINQCHDNLHIEMYGYNSSMNVVQAATVTLYELCKQLNH